MRGKEAKSLSFRGVTSISTTMGNRPPFISRRGDGEAPLGVVGSRVPPTLPAPHPSSACHRGGSAILLLIVTLLLMAAASNESHAQYSGSINGFDTALSDFFSIAGNTPTPTPTSTATATSTHTITPTPTESVTPTSTGTPTQTSTVTSTATETPLPPATSTTSATPTPTVTATPSTTPIPTLTTTHIVTETPTTTPTQTSTITSSPTVTPTSTPTETLIAPPIPLAPPVIQRPTQGDEPLIINRNAPEISGSGPPGETVVVLVNSLQAGSTVIPSSGQWKVALPALAAGMHQLQAFSVNSDGARSELSASIILAVVETAPLDFSGTGKTSITTWRRAGSDLSFRVRTIDASAWNTYRVEGDYPALGDYDGDGITDLAGIGTRGNTLVWNIRRSGSLTTSSVVLGERGDTVITGCRLRSSAKHSLASFARERRVVRVTELDERGTEVRLLPGIKNGDLIGCGDVTGDDLDELIFKTPGRNDDSSLIVAIDSTGRQRLRKPLSRFVRGYVVKRPGTEAPLLAILNPTSGQGIPIRVETVAGTFNFPLFYIAPGSTIASGLFGDDISDQHPGIFWVERDSQMIFYRVFSSDSRTTSLFKMPRGYRILRASTVFETDR